MSAGSNVELSIGAVLENSVEIYVHNQFASETGEVIVFDSNSTEVARSSTITVYQSSTSVTITGLDGGTEYTAKFYSETVGDYSLSTLDFTTLRHNKLYGSVNSQAKRITKLYGSENGQSTRIIKVYGPEQVTINVYSVTDIANNTGFNASTFMSKYNAEYGDMTDEPTGLTIGEVPIGSGDMKAFLRFTQGVETKMLFTWTKDNYNGEGADWGFASEPVTGLITSTSTTQTGYQTRRVF